MAHYLNKFKIQKILIAIDVPFDTSLVKKFSHIFATSLLICKKVFKNDAKEIEKIQSLKEQLYNKILELSPSDKEIISLMLNKINYQENLNVTPLEWLTCESLAVYLIFLDKDLFPITGKSLFKKWCQFQHENAKNKIKILQEQINKISLDAKRQIYKETLKWKVGALSDNLFDYYLKFISFLKTDDNKKYILESNKVA